MHSPCLIRPDPQLPSSVKVTFLRNRPNSSGFDHHRSSPQPVSIRSDRRILQILDDSLSQTTISASIGNLVFVWHAVLRQRGIRDRASLIIHC
ncbi:MAG: hypothetical protein DWI02_07225 [Planctomycetota bacterium]|nr:MAG: hypothetical protein DWI02_07225 [Planctomycetota bacterium]